MKSWSLEKSASIKSQRVDTAKLSDEELYEVYMQAVIPSVRKKFGIRRVFGSRKRSGYLFGKGVPALLVYDHEGEYPVDVYPHKEVGRIITIEEFLQELLTRRG